MTIEVFSPCSSELKPGLERFIKFVFLNKRTANGELYVVDESSEEMQIKKFWDKITGLTQIPYILFINYSNLEPPGCLEFLKSVIAKWERWNPAGRVFLKQVLERMING
jgi:hypothetical protein